MSAYTLRTFPAGGGPSLDPPDDCVSDDVLDAAIDARDLLCDRLSPCASPSRRESLLQELLVIAERLS